MINVRDYLKMKKDREEEKVRVNYREKIKSHKFTIFYRMALVIILTVAIILANIHHRILHLEGLVPYRIPFYVHTARTIFTVSEKIA